MQCQQLDFTVDTDRLDHVKLVADFQNEENVFTLERSRVRDYEETQTQSWEGMSWCITSTGPKPGEMGGLCWKGHLAENLC